MADFVDISVDDAINEFEVSQFNFSEDAAYYNAEKRDIAIGVATPPALRELLAKVGIPRVYVHAIAERLTIEGFRQGGASSLDEELWDWFRANSLDTDAFSAFVDALVYGRAYITLSASPEGEDDPLAIPDVPRIRLESPLSLYAKINPTTRRVDWAVRVIRDENGNNESVTLYLPDRTEFYDAGYSGLRLVETVNHGLGVVPVVPMYRPSGLTDLYGTSIITPELRNITDAISRLVMNLQTTSELMATPQRIVFGTTAEDLRGEAKTGLELYTASYLAIEDPTGKAVQLQAAELRNYTEALTHYLKLAASYTGLPPQYLSFSDDNPASAEAIKSSEERLVRTCESIASMFGDAWERAMRIACLVQGRPLDTDMFRLETVWRDPSTPTYAAKADASAKLYANGTGPIPKQQVRLDMGYTHEEIRQMEIWDSLSPLSQAVSMYGDASVGLEATPEVVE